MRSRGYELVETFVEPGATATNDRRPEFQRMIEAGTSKPAPFDVVIVHSFSRFFRDAFDMEFYVRKLAKNGVKLVSITQEMGDDPMHVMMRQIMALFDEYQSKENAKHVLRAMNENARQGFWNGALPPIGYRIVAAEQRGSKTKKKLEIDPLHADTVRLIYRLFLEGDGVKGPMGVKAITCHLNERRIFTRDGGRWGLASIHQILTRTTYIGEHRFNKRSHKDRERKPESEVAVMACPPLIDRETFDTVQARLKARDPRMTPARVTSGPTLLTGICFCAKCGGAMTLRTGKGSAGGVYRYYTCSTKARQGKTGCEGRSIPMDPARPTVAATWKTACFSPSGWKPSSPAFSTDARSAPSAAASTWPNCTSASPRPTSGSIGSSTPSSPASPISTAPGLKERIAGLKAIREQASADAERAQAALDHAGNQAVSPDMVRTFARAARQRIRLDSGGYRRDHLRALAQRVEVADKEVRIMGSKSELLRTLVAASGGKPGVAGVHSSVLKWRARNDSNVRPSDS